MRAGHPYDQFWRITLREFDLIMGATSARIQDQFKLERSLSYGLAALIRVAFNSPKDFPKFEEFMGGERREADPMDLERYLTAMAKIAPPPKTKQQET